VQLSVRDLERIFRKLAIETKESKHHKAGFLVVDGRRVLPLHYSHGRKPMPGHVSEKFRKATKLNSKEFAKLTDCSMTRDDYLALLRQRGVC
jgi:hypothetical protein